MLEIGTSACCVSSSPQRGCWEIARKAREIGFKRQKSNCIRPRQDRASASERSRLAPDTTPTRGTARTTAPTRAPVETQPRVTGTRLRYRSILNHVLNPARSARCARSAKFRYELRLVFCISHRANLGGCAPLAFMASSVISGQWSYSARLRRVGLWETETLSGAGQPISIATVPKNARRRLEAAATSH